MKTLLFLTLLLPQGASANSLGYLLTRYMAKEYCSCRFVVKQSPTVCRNENKSFKILVRITEDSKKKIIKVQNAFTRTEAHFINEDQGCLLEKDL